MTPFANTEYPPGKHVLLEFWDARGLTDLKFIEAAIANAALTCGATILEMRLYQFGKEGGITGVALLAESHISIHTWPELEYAALDVFMCGKCDAENAIEPLKEYFKPAKFKINCILRGKYE